MTIFKTEVDTKLALTHDQVVRSEMEFDQVSKQRLPGLTTFNHGVSNLPNAKSRRDERQ